MVSTLFSLHLKRFVPVMWIAFLVAQSSYAGLGRSESSVEEDRLSVHGAVTVQVREGYQVHEIVASGRTIKEFALPDGTIFAISWRGVSQPDLSQFLGGYFDEFRAAEAKGEKDHGRKRKTIQSQHIAVEKFGHMRDVRGRAYISSLMPAGLKPQDIN